MPDRKTKRRTVLGREIIRGLTEAAESLERGVPLGTMKTVELPDEPGEYDGAGVRATRASLNASQAVFARVMGVSTILVRSWENGSREPSRLARRLLDEINREPRRWAALVANPKQSPATRRKKPLGKNLPRPDSRRAVGASVGRGESRGTRRIAR
jgi:putative transcriptional regulator